jgi:hypothetical protein
MSPAGNVGQQEVSPIELGRFNPYPPQLERLAHIFGLPPDVLLKPVTLQIVEASVERAEQPA